MSTRQPLAAWLYGTRIATLSESYDGRLKWNWTPEALDRWAPGTRVLGAKMPIGANVPPPMVKTWLEGLLPEGNARTNRAMDFGIGYDDTFALIRALGRDTAGAAVFAPVDTDAPERTGHYEAIELSEVAQKLRDADRHSPSEPGETRDSSTLPGMVPKITLHREADQWMACKDGAPSTWIIKRAPDGDYADTESLCLDLAGRVGLTNIRTEMLELEDQRAIAVSRYDRRPNDPWSRIHQEDLAQATGLNTDDPNRKFQWGGKMPSLKHAADVLEYDGASRDGLLALATFSVLVGNSDMHAKNISFLRHPDGLTELSPAYDIGMHMYRDGTERRSALDVNGKIYMDQIRPEDLVAEGRSWGMPARRATAVVTSTIEATQECLDDVSEASHRGVSDQAWTGLRSRIRSF